MKLNFAPVIQYSHSNSSFLVQKPAIDSFSLSRIHQIPRRCMNFLLKSILVRGAIQRSAVWKCLCSSSHQSSSTYSKSTPLPRITTKMMSNSNVINEKEFSLETELLLSFNGDQLVCATLLDSERCRRTAVSNFSIEIRLHNSLNRPPSAFVTSLVRFPVIFDSQ
jgi:hypothetical protein